MTTIRISDQPAALTSVTFDERAMGKTRPELARMVLTTPYSAFAKRFDPVYAEAVEELKADDQVTGKFSPPYEGATEYPTLDELFQLSESARMEMIGAFFTVDILRLLVTEAAAQASWAVRSIDSVARHGDVLELRGAVEKL